MQTIMTNNCVSGKQVKSQQQQQQNKKANINLPAGNLTRNPYPSSQSGALSLDYIDKCAY